MPAPSTKLPWLVLTALLLSWAGEATAADVHVVVLARPGTPLAARLRAELVHLGFAADQQNDGDPLQLLGQLARDQAEGAVLRIDTAAPRIEVWLPSPSHDGPIASEVVTIAGLERGHDDIVVRAIEVLRAKLLERGITVVPAANEAAPTRPASAAQPTSPTPAVATEPSRNVTETRPARLWLGVGGSGLLNPGGLPAAGAVTLELGASLLPFLRVGLTGSLPVLVPSVSNVEGSTTISPSLLGISLMLQRPPRAWPLQPYAGVGLAGLWLRCEGSAQQPYVGQSVLPFGWVPFVRGGGRLLLARWLALQLDVMAGWAVPTLEVTVVGRPIATVGRPLLAGTLALAIGLAP